MEEENQAFGKKAETKEPYENLESEDFCFYKQNKEEMKNNIVSSSKDLTDFIDTLIQDMPGPTEDEVKSGIDNILVKVQPAELQVSTSKNNMKKTTLKVLFIAALLSIISASCLVALGNSHKISIENGFVSFAKDTIQIVFFGEGEEYITIDALLHDLENHGYGDILFPQHFTTRSDEIRVSVPEYLNDDLGNQATFEVYFSDVEYKFGIFKYNQSKDFVDYVNVADAETYVFNDVSYNVLEFNGEMTIEFVYNDYYYVITSKIAYSDMLKLIESIR